MKERKIKLIGLLSIIMIVLLVVGATFAYFVSQTGSSSSVDIDVTTATTDNLTFSTGDEISLSASMSNFGTGMSSLTGSTSATATLTANNATNSASATYYVYLRISINGFTYTADQSTPELILTITDPNGSEVTSLDGLTYYSSIEDNTGVSYSGFDITTSKGLITIAENYEITSTGTETDEWTITVTFINLSTDQSDNAGVEINAELIVGEDEEKETLTEYIMSLHSIDGTNSLYYFDGKGNYANSDLEAGDYSYRYSGASDAVSNFVCFGSDDCSDTDNLYRIIGVFQNDLGEYEVKLMKYDYCTAEICGEGGDYYGTYSTADSIWNYNTSTYYIGNQGISNFGAYYWNYINYQTAYNSNGGYYNDWNYSQLNTVNLNSNFYNNLDSTWQNMIATHSWIVGGNTSFKLSTNSTALSAYTSEITSPVFNQVQSTYDDEIGLIYVSDYYYSASPIFWDYFGYDASSNNDYSNARTYNWMYLGVTEWTITRTSSNNVAIFRISFDGPLIVGGGSIVNSVALAARPAFYLSSSVEYSSGSGTQSDPIILVTE